MYLTFSQCKQVAEITNLRDVCERMADVPEWIDCDIELADVFAVNQGGCTSGAYMPAVTYHLASQTMAKFGDDVLEYIENNYGEIPAPNDGESWSGLACFYLSIAVELWCAQFSELSSIEY